MNEGVFGYFNQENGSKIHNLGERGMGLVSSVFGGPHPMWVC